MVFIEPTPYVLDLLEKGFENLNERADVVFMTKNLTQNWSVQERAVKYTVFQSKKQMASCLMDIILKRKYRLVHIAGWSNLFSLSLILLSRLFFYPVIIETDTPLNPSTALWKKIIKKIFYPILFKFPAFFLPAGTRQAHYLKHYGVNTKKMILAQMTVDVEYIQRYLKTIHASERDQLRMQYHTECNDVVFLFVGRLLDLKGIRELITAFQSLGSKQVKLWIIGDGELAPEVKLASRKNEKILYLGRVSGDQLLRIYHAADVFVISSHHESWCLVVNEAMAAGLPVIATETLGCVDDLLLGHHGIIVKPKNVGALSDAMCRMLQNPDQRKLIGKSAAEHISNWTLKNEADNITSAWNTVLSG